jgi:intracellular sulfur oxidation DsrE/DsrF family protein
MAIPVMASATSLHPQVAKWIESQQPPLGVVFELLSREPHFIEKRTPYIETQIVALKQAFAELDIVIVSHGRELNALTLTQQTQPYMQTFENLSRQGVNIHVCEVVAARLNKTADDFPRFIDVTPSGTAQLNDYKQLGYSVIRVP